MDSAFGSPPTPTVKQRVADIDATGGTPPDTPDKPTLAKGSSVGKLFAPVEREPAKRTFFTIDARRAEAIGGRGSFGGTASARTRLPTTPARRRIHPAIRPAPLAVA